jgi:hypothetical protein
MVGWCRSRIAVRMIVVQGSRQLNRRGDDYGFMIGGANLPGQSEQSFLPKLAFAD